MTNKGIPSYDDKLREINAKFNRLLDILRMNGSITHGQYLIIMGKVE